MTYMDFGKEIPPFGFGTVGGWQSAMGGTTTGGTGTSPGTAQDGRWPPGVIPPTKWCVKETTIWGSIKCIPPEPVPPPPPPSTIPGREAIGPRDQPPPEKKVQIDVDWKVECICAPVNVDSEGNPSTPYDPPSGGRISEVPCENGKRNFHFFDNKYEYDCLPITGGSSGYGEDPERTRVISTSRKECICVNPSGGYTPANTCSGKRSIIIDLLTYPVLFKQGDEWGSDGGASLPDYNGFGEPDLAMKLALEKCKVKKTKDNSTPPSRSPHTFIYKIESYEGWSAQDQIDCLNNLICCEGKEDSKTRYAAGGVIKKLINDLVRSIVIPPFTKCNEDGIPDSYG